MAEPENRAALDGDGDAKSIKGAFVTQGLQTVAGAKSSFRTALKCQGHP